MEKKLMIQAMNLSKSFEIDILRRETALAGVISFLRKKTEKKQIEAIKNLSLSAYSNEILGVIGANGSGKSTLLRLLADIYKPDSGKVITSGKVTYLSGFRQGLNGKLKMRENIYLMGSILGLSQRDIKKRYQEIVDFSGLNEFTETPLYKFSDGMITRLAFSVTIHCLEHNYPEIMLLDEVIEAGGDLSFKEQAMNKMEELIKGGAAVIMASHSLENIQRYCDRVLLLDKGIVVKEGKPGDVIKDYLAMNKT